MVRKLFATLALAGFMVIAAAPAVLAQADAPDAEGVDAVFGVLSAIVVAFGPLAVGVTKLVDGVRNLFPKASKAFWVPLAFVIAVGVCLLFEINVTAPIVAMVPAFDTSNALDGVAGQVVTGLGVAGFASFWHEQLDARSALAKQRRLDT